MHETLATPAEPLDRRLHEPIGDEPSKADPEPGLLPDPLLNQDLAARVIRVQAKDGMLVEGLPGIVKVGGPFLVTSLPGHRYLLVAHVNEFRSIALILRDEGA